MWGCSEAADNDEALGLCDKELAMLICIIEFETLPGMDERRRELLVEMMAEAETIDGFLSKETFKSIDGTDKVVTLSYWRDAESLRNWMRHAGHRRAIVEGNQKLFSRYTIQLAEITSDKIWKKDAPRAT